MKFKLYIPVGGALLKILPESGRRNRKKSLRYFRKRFIFPKHTQQEVFQIKF
jgi:hypothetical protein